MSGKELQVYLLTLASGFNLLTSVSLLGCYGVPPAKASEDWMCSRCSANALEEVSASMLLLSPCETSSLTIGLCHADSMSQGSVQCLVHSDVGEHCRSKSPRQ